jgi:pimeloyl-ACP methyl ester carboxylesterase
VRFSGIPRLRGPARRAVAAGLAALAFGVQVAPASAAADPATCQDVYLPVTLAGQQQTMFGHLCRPSRPTSTVLLLVPGATYTAAYWDLPASLGLFSFRGALNDAGYATLAVDRLGSGRSSRPASALLTRGCGPTCCLGTTATRSTSRRTRTCSPRRSLVGRTSVIGGP